jgi:ribosomal protein S18 acetylase RimI-like enzyme
VTGLNIAPLSTADVSDLVGLWREAGLTRPWNSPTDDAQMALAGPTSAILGGRIEGRLAASIMVGWDGHRGAVYYLAVADQHRGQGYGRELMRAAEAWLAQFNAPKLNLMVRTDNDAAHGFYDSLDYARDPVTIRSKRLRP